MALDKNKRKKVAVLITSKGKPGGLERRFIALFLELSKRPDAEFMLICHESLLREFKGLNNKVRVYDEGSLLPTARKITSILKENHISHVHVAANPTLLSLLLGVNALLKGIVMTISSVDSSKISPDDFSFYSKLAHRGTYFFAKKIDFLSPSIQEVHSNLFGVNPKKIEVAPCSFLALRKAGSHQKRRRYDLCFVSRLVPLKGVELLVAALQRIDRSLVVRICGDGKLKQEFIRNEKIIAHHQVILGYSTNPTEELAQSKVFLSLQKHNNYPSQSLLEAITCGCAVIATDVGETRMIVTENNGRLVNSTTELVDSIEELLSDECLRERLVAESRSVIDSAHTLENFVSYFTSRVIGL
ncbi:MAG: glycosyltransferase family 4 protein [Oleiphilaceae bacterium]|nr:glycosyltransferase family 4 protein [Oleiphilaceae bacterium]